MKTFEKNEKITEKSWGHTIYKSAHISVVLGFETWHRIKAKIIVFNMRPSVLL